jgi:HAD superfamily hydrolase (TIGR01509 family)
VSSPQPAQGFDALPAAVLFDMDGLLIDTEPIWFAVETEILDEVGARWLSDDHATLLGSSLPVASAFISERATADVSPAGIARRGGADVSPSAIADQMLLRMARRLRDPLPLQPGVAELLGELDNAGIPRALVSSSFRMLVEPVLEGLAPVSFDVVVAGDDVSHNKPHPEPYLTAAARLGVDAADCVAFEDSPNGAASASAAGCVVVAVPSVAPIEPAHRRIVCRSVADVDLAFLRSLFVS